MILTYIATTLFMLIIDMAWLTSRASTHKSLFKAIQGTDLEPRLIPAALVYLLIPAAVIYFAVSPNTSLSAATLDGALLGLAMYGLYDLTNYATLKAYTLEMTVIDTLWGGALCATGAAFAYFLTTRFFRKRYSMFNTNWLFSGDPQMSMKAWILQ